MSGGIIHYYCAFLGDKGIYDLVVKHAVRLVDGKTQNWGENGCFQGWFCFVFFLVTRLHECHKTTIKKNEGILGDNGWWWTLDVLFTCIVLGCVWNENVKYVCLLLFWRERDLLIAGAERHQWGGDHTCVFFSEGWPARVGQQGLVHECTYATSDDHLYKWL